MKSYFLEAVVDEALARKELTKHLPGQIDPWLLGTPNGNDTVAFIYIVQGESDGLQGPFIIQADISGRHYHEDQCVIDFLGSLQTILGGAVQSD